MCRQLNSEEQNRVDFLIDFMGTYLTMEVVERLQAMGFFRAPASLKRHGTYEGALFHHSLTVATTLVEFTEKLGLEWQSPRSPFIVGIFHDLCKCDNYVKDADGQWIWNKKTLLPGHGEKSVIMAQALYGRLTDEEICCIRWHMGAFEGEETKDCYGRAVTEFPNVLYTHTADMEAARVKGI